MTTTPEYVALEARVTNLERDYRRDLTTKLAVLEQTVKSLVTWSTTVDVRLDRLESKVDALDAKFDDMDGKLDLVLAYVQGAPDSPE